MSGDSESGTTAKALQSDGAVRLDSFGSKFSNSLFPVSVGCCGDADEVK